MFNHSIVWTYCVLFGKKYFKMFIKVLCAFLALPILIVLYFKLKYFKHKRALRNVPGLPTLPILGNVHQMGQSSEEILYRLFGWWNDFGHSNFICWNFYSPFLVIVSPKDLEFILNSNTLIQKSDGYDLLHSWLGFGLLTSTGSKWHKHRKMITPSFHFKILQDFHETMNINSNKFIEKLRQVSANDNIFDFQDQTHYFTLDVICDTAMGVPINAMDNNDSVLVKAFKDMCYIINMRALHPWNRFDTLYKFSSDYPHYQKTLKILQDFTNEVIVKRTEARKNDTDSTTKEDEFSCRKMAFLDTLLTSTIDGRPLNQQEIAEEVSTFMFAGQDTTTSGIAFSTYLLSRHPEVQRKIYEEQKLIMGNELKRDATFQEIAEMKYLDLFIKESQRVYPSVPLVGRFTEKDYNINGMFVPKGTTLNLFLISLGYDDRVFKDPYRFQPERFESEKPGPFEYLPFSAGPRNCIGQKFAVLEMKTVISKIVRTFEVLPALDELVSKDGYLNTFLGMSKEELAKNNPNPHKYDPILTAVLTLKSQNGLHLRLKERI